jgi:hypothetical protein
MENKGLIFIPDISGFTRFVNDTDIQHSRMIIEELLNVLINSNQLGLEISEIEGDAILFYKFGDSPDLNELYKQVEKMFCDFHKNIGAYHITRFCYCKACSSAINLSLKVISHYGEFTSYNVKKFNKLIGKDIIVAHQLLKNDIEKHEYWLVTNDLLHNHEPANLTRWMQWNASAKQTETGEISFQYTQLSQLKNEIANETLPQLELSKKTKMFTLTKEFETDIITLFHASGDFNYRNRWQEGVKKVEEVTHMLPRVGMKSRRTMENGEETIYASSYFYSDEKIEFSETDEGKKNSTYFTLEKINDNKTKMTVDYYISKNMLGETIFRMTRKRKVEKGLGRSLQNLERMIRNSRPGEL